MLGKLITLPARIYLRATVRVLRFVRDTALPPSRQPAPPQPASDQPATPRESATPARAARKPAARKPAQREQPAPAPVPVPREPAIDLETPGPLDPRAGHVSEEPVLVDERADPGAEYGAGAQIHITHEGSTDQKRSPRKNG